MVIFHKAIRLIALTCFTGGHDGSQIHDARFSRQAFLISSEDETLEDFCPIELMRDAWKEIPELLEVSAPFLMLFSFFSFFAPSP